MEYYAGSWLEASGELRPSRVLALVRSAVSWRKEQRGICISDIALQAPSL
jgi:hypothetical protein